MTKQTAIRQISFAKVAKKIGIALSFLTMAVVIIVALFAVAIDRIFDWRWSRDEVARVASPSGRLDAVMFELNGGVTTSFAYEVHVVPTGKKPIEVRGAELANLYGSVRSESAYGANLRWQDDRTLVVEYLEARNAQLNHPTLEINGTTVTLKLQSGVIDPAAPPGGMLFNRKDRRTQ